MSDRDRELLTPAYLRGVLTVEAELADGHIGLDGWMRTDAISPVLVALSYVDGTASLVTEDGNGQLTRLRIPGWAFLRLIDGAERMLATSREQSGTQATPQVLPVMHRTSCGVRPLGPQFRRTATCRRCV